MSCCNNTDKSLIAFRIRKQARHITVNTKVHRQLRPLYLQNNVNIVAVSISHYQEIVCGLSLGIHISIW